MPVGLLGRKIGMTQVYEEGGVVVPVTVLELGPCPVLQLRTVDRDGYEAVQIGFGEKPRRLASKAERGHVRSDLSSKRKKQRTEAGVELLEKADCESPRFIREFRTDGEGVELSVGEVLTVEAFNEIPRVDVIATSKGRGTAGVMKRHNFAGQRASHGVKKVHRHGGSIGQSADPSRVLKGTKMAGQYGNARSTIRNLKVVRIDVEEGLILVAGGVPGPSGGLVEVRPTNKLG